MAHSHLARKCNGWSVASREEEAARRELDSAERLLRSCLRPRGGPAAVRRSGAVQPLVERLQAAYADIWQLKLLQGFDKLTVGYCVMCNRQLCMLSLHGSCLKLLGSSSMAAGRYDLCRAARR